MGKLVVGVTGGIGSGKTTVAKLFETLGAGLVDTDEIAHELTRAGQPAVEQIRKQFGPEYVDAEGALHRARMRALVFSDAQARAKLEAILHPLIRAAAEVRDWTARRAPTCCWSFRCWWKRGATAGKCSAYWWWTATRSCRSLASCGVAACPSSRLERSSPARPRASSVCAAADDVITNNAGLAELAEQVRRLHTRYLAMAAQT